VVLTMKHEPLSSIVQAAITERKRQSSLLVLRFLRQQLRSSGCWLLSSRKRKSPSRDTQRPIPDHISVRHEDIASLMAGLIAFDHGAESDLDPVIAEAVLAFRLFEQAASLHSVGA
jgi:hypothetical protein